MIDRVKKLETCMLMDLRRLYKNALDYFSDTMTDDDVAAIKNRQVLLKQFMIDANIKTPHTPNIFEFVTVDGDKKICDCGGLLCIEKSTNAIKKNNGDRIKCLLTQAGFVAGVWVELRSFSVKELGNIDENEDLGEETQNNILMKEHNIFECSKIQQPERFKIQCMMCKSEYPYELYLNHHSYIVIKMSKTEGGDDDEFEEGSV